MMQKLVIVTFAVFAAIFAAVASAQQKPSTYPANGQTPAQQGADDSYCLSWAKQSTGIDPAAVAATPVVPSGPQGERARGAARGAVAGAVVGGATGGSRNNGAAVGATAGVVAGGARSRRKQAAQVQQGEAAKVQTIDTYYNAYGACMQGRGYSVR